jgi:polysaccharide biosynthesis transport protein
MNLEARTPGGDLRGLARLFMRRLRLFLAIVIVVFAATLVAVMALKPIYTAQSSIKIDPNQRSAIDVAALAQDGAQDSALIDTEIALMQSRDVASGAVKRLNLISDPEFNRALGRPASGPPLNPRDIVERTIDRVQRKLSATREGVSYIIRIQARSNSATKAMQLANAAAEEYIAVGQRQKSAAAAAQEEALSGRAADLQNQAEQASAAVARFKAQAGIVAGGGTNGTVTDQEAGALATELSRASNDAAQANARANAAHDQIARAGIDSVAEVLDSPVISDLRRQRTEIVREKAQINSRYLPLHPESIRVQNQLDQVDAQIRSESQRIVSGLDSAARASNERVQTLQARLNSIEGRQASNARAGVASDALQRRADSLTSLANTTTEAVQRAAEQARVGETQSRIAALATAPRSPSFPNKPLFAGLGLFVGALLAASIILIFDALDPTVRTVGDIERDLGVAYIASVPLLTGSKRDPRNSRLWDYVVDKPFSGFAESLRTVRSTIKLAFKGSQIITITSALPNEGKTATAIALARVLAMSGDRVILIDGDLRRRALQKLFSPPPTVGLIEVLTGSAGLDAAIVADHVKGLDLLPVADALDSAPDLFSGPGVEQLFNALRSRYDHIIIDTPPMLAVAEVRLLAALSDTVLLVIRWGKTPRQAVNAALARLEQDRTKVGGAVLTMVDLQAKRQFNEEDANYYYKSYRSYYVE